MIEKIVNDNALKSINDTKGRVHSFQSLGTVDGPGIRFVVFTQGCPLRCGCCHNPDTWEYKNGQEYLASEIVSKALRYTSYFGKDGGVTASGGEPLIQADFVSAIFQLCKQKGINTCLDTSGCILNEKVKKLLSYTDRVLLDIKYTDNDSYKKYVGCDLNSVISFLEYLNAKRIPTTIRQVIIPTLNDNDKSIIALKNLAKKYKCVDKIELLPFKKICKVKYDQMGIPFPFENLPTPDGALMKKLNELLNA
ncbi:MAG: pyruvate formate lyase-activating protein [Clostridia bacterium]|nr:pyruvate formate lyase-activating protein [Clostridia bacterium]